MGYFVGRDMGQLLATITCWGTMSSEISAAFVLKVKLDNWYDQRPLH